MLAGPDDESLRRAGCGKRLFKVFLLGEDVCKILNSFFLQIK
jgi:hypothetical protein